MSFYMNLFLNNNHNLRRLLPVNLDEDTALDGDVRVIDESGEDYLYLVEYVVPTELSKQVKESVLKVA
jgi:hypothetical protein